MPRHVDWELSVSLEGTSSNDVLHKDDYFKAIEDRYASKYCCALGVEPLPHHKAAVTHFAPLGDCVMEATWADGSSVASKLAIVQPNMSSAKESMQGQDGLAQREWFGRATYMNVMPPDRPREVAARFDMESQSKSKADAAQQYMQRHAFESMKLQDQASSSKIVDFSNLTDELERTRLRVRSDLEDERAKADVFGRVLKSKGRRGQAEQELENLKVKYLLPYACERIGSSNLLPWQSPDLRKHPNIHVHEDFLENAKMPIALTMPQLEEEIFAYACVGFPVELLTTRVDIELFAAIREQLVTEESVRLVGLLAHLLYWIVLGHVHEPSKRLPDQSKQSLVLTIQELWSLIQAPARQRLGRRGELLSKDGPAGISFAIPAFMLALKRGVEWCFQVSYPWMFADAKITTQLIDQINLLFMRLFDPDCLYASFGALEASERAINLWRKLGILQASLGVTPARRIINQEFRTTPLMSLLLLSDGGNPGDPKTRVLLSKSSSESMIGSASQEPTKAGGNSVTGWQRAALYRSANKRLNGLQRVGLQAAGESAGITEKAKSGFMKSKGSIHNRSSKKSSGTHTRSSERTTSSVGSESTVTVRTML